VELAAGDTLVLYTDGITEAENADGEEFGASRLLDTRDSPLRNKSAPAQRIHEVGPLGGDKSTRYSACRIDSLSSIRIAVAIPLATSIPMFTLPRSIELMLV
jgi:hypothetical protein